jgi:hypothetical protein
MFEQANPRRHATIPIRSGLTEPLRIPAASWRFVCATCKLVSYSAAKRLPAGWTPRGSDLHCSRCKWSIRV